jgi:hypothetical protein
MGVLAEPYFKYFLGDFAGEFMDRYQGKPLLRLLEYYVLAAIDQLDDKQHAVLESMGPKLSALYNRHGTWFEIIHNEMDFLIRCQRRFVRCGQVTSLACTRMVRRLTQMSLPWRL